MVKCDGNCVDDIHLREAKNMQQVCDAASEAIKDGKSNAGSCEPDIIRICVYKIAVQINSLPFAINLVVYIRNRDGK